MVEKKLSYKVDYVTNFKESGFDSLMKKQAQLQQSIESTTKIARRLAGGGGRVTGQDLAESQTFLSSKMTDFQKQNLSFLAAIEMNTRGAVITKKGSRTKAPDGIAERLFGDIENRRTKGILRTKTNIFTPTGATSAGGVMTSLLTTISPMIVVAIGLMTAIFAVIVSSSRMLQRTLGNIMKFIMMFVRPIGDMIAVLLYPLMMILRPLSLLINTMIRPFLMEARKSFRLGLQLGRQSEEARAQGEFGIAADLANMSQDMFGTGLATLAAGFGKLFVNLLGGVIELAVTSMINVLMIPMELLVGVIDTVTGGVFNLSETLGAAKQGAIAFVESGFDAMLNSVNAGFDDFLNTVTSKNDAVATLSSNVGTWLTNADSLSKVDLETVIGNIELMIDEFQDASILNTAEAFKTAKENMEILGETIDTTIQTLLNKYKTDSNSNIHGFGAGGGSGAGGGGGGAGGDDSDWWSSAISILTGLFTDLTSPLDEVQKLISGDFTGAFIDFVAGPMDELITAYGSLQQATMDLHGEGGHGFVELQTEVAKNISSMNLFSYTTSRAIGAIDSAVGQAKNFAAQAASAASRAASAAASARSAASSSKGSKATGGSVDQNGMYYLHRGETVTNPVDSSFKNTSGGNSGGNITINMQGSTFGNFSEWKREMDKYFSQQMRHMR